MIAAHSIIVSGDTATVVDASGTPQTSISLARGYVAEYASLSTADRVRFRLALLDLAANDSADASDRLPALQAVEMIAQRNGLTRW